MDTKFEALPPLKRFRLLQKQQQHPLVENEALSLQLPAKKRKESRDAFLPHHYPSTYSLPAKKRVWALQPGSLSGTPFESEQSDKETEEIEEEEEDDGILCAICESTDGDPTDPIVLCDGCDLMVHVSCYGNPLVKGVPEGDWFCAQCLNQSDNNHNKEPFSCCLCPSKVGAMKPTTKDGSWAHIVCAVFVPEVFFQDPIGRDGIDCSKVPKKRWHEKKCCVCESKQGCVIGCSEPKCGLAFHITCGLGKDFCIEYEQGKKNRETIVAGFCRSHSELWKKQRRTGKFKIVAAREEHK